MKCIFLVDQDVNPVSMTEEERAKVRFRPQKVRSLTGKSLANVVPYFPAGTAYEHPNAAYFVIDVGSAVPGDAECVAAVKAAGTTKEELAAMQHRYKRMEDGIQLEDVPLYDAGVILGYKKLPNGEHEYIHGPKWDEYQAALDSVEKTETEDDL